MTSTRLYDDATGQSADEPLDLVQRGAGSAKSSLIEVARAVPVRRGGGATQRGRHRVDDRRRPRS
jgi:hypothetical protein